MRWIDGRIINVRGLEVLCDNRANVKRGRIVSEVVNRQRQSLCKRNGSHITARQYVASGVKDAWKAMGVVYLILSI